MTACIRSGRRRRAALLAALTLALVGCTAGSSSGNHASGIQPPSERVGEVVDVPVPAAIRDLPLTTSDGRRTTLGAYQGRPVMIADYLTLCEDICPMITANTVSMARTLARNGMAGKVALLELTLDPHRDTLPRLRAYRKLYGSPPAGWTLLRASPANTRTLWKYFGVYYKRVPEGKPADTDWLTGKPLTYDLDHQDAVIFLDANEHERFVIDGSPNASGHHVPGRLVSALSAQGRHNLHHPDPVADWTTGQGLQVLSWLTGTAIPGASRN